jgi:hypothetical protein
MGMAFTKQKSNLHAPLKLEVVFCVVVVYPFIPLGTKGICEASPSVSVSQQPLNLTPCFATFSCFLQNGPFPCLLQPSSPSGSLQVPIQCLFFNEFIPLPQSVPDPSPLSLYNF